MNFFSDAYVDRRNGTFFTYRSGRVSYEECISGGIYYPAGWLASSYAPQTIIYGQVPRPDFRKPVRNSAFRIVVDGAELYTGWEFADYVKDETGNGLRVTVVLENGDAGMELRVVTLLDGTDIITRYLEIRNLRADRRFISELKIMSGLLQQTERPAGQLGRGENIYRLGYMEGTNWGLEGAFSWHEIQGDGGYTVSGRFDRDRFRHPVFLLQNRVNGLNFICQLGYSGGWKAEFDLMRDATAWGEFDSYMSFGIGIDGFAPVADVGGFETLTTPEVHIGAVYGDHDDAFNAMHDHVRRSVVRPTAEWTAPLEMGLGGEMDMEMPGVVNSIEFAAKYGAEYFIIDHGWQFQPGSDTSKHGWIPNTSRYEGGLERVIEMCREKGIRFGIWMEPERVFDEFEKFTDEHPGSCVTPYSGDYSPDRGPLAVFRPEVAGLLYEMIDEVIGRYRPDLFRLDHNMFARGFTTKDGVRVYGDMDYFREFYAVMDRLREKYPGCIIENCASGGGRTDLGMMARSDHTWVTDWQRAPRSFMITNGMTMCLPPEFVDRIITAQIGHPYGSFEFQSFQLLFGRPTLNASTANGTVENPLQEEILMRVINAYKNVVQPCVARGVWTDMFHHTPEFGLIDPVGTGIIERTARDGSFGVLGIFNLSSSGDYCGDICFRGKIDPGAVYTVTALSDGRSFRLAGADLRYRGINASVRGAMKAECFLAVRTSDNNQREVKRNE